MKLRNKFVPHNRTESYGLPLRNTFFDYVDPRRKQELHDSMLIEEDHRAMANLSPVAIHREVDSDMFNRSPMWSDEVRDWTVIMKRGISEDE